MTAGAEPASGRTIAETERLTLREGVIDDAPFLCRLMNSPGWRRYIGDHDVDTPEAAAIYLAERYFPAYAQGVGLWVAALKGTGEPIGVCGLVQRAYLNEPDLGFAFLEAYRGDGYAREAAAAVVAVAQLRGVHRLAAITAPDNRPSIGLLEKLGFRYVGPLTPPASEEALSLYELGVARVA